MPVTKLTIWTNVAYPGPAMDLLRHGTAGHDLVFAQKQEYSNLAKPQPDPNLDRADVAFGQPDAGQLLTTSRLKWAHLTTAGYTAYDRDDLRAAFKSRGATLTNSSAVYAEPCAQHVLALMLAQARQLASAVKSQLTDHSWHYRQIREASVLLNGQTALIVGYGAIGQRVAELLAPFRMNLIAVRRKPTGREPIRTVATDEIDQHLPSADHVINILPLAPGTEKFFDAPRLARLKPTCVFYNVGRGNTVDQVALRAALVENRLAAACLDVTTPEPLPPTDPLWTAPNLLITPHTAGGHTTEFPRVVQHFLDNLRRFERGEPLADVVY